ncbi:pyridoxal phosphate-dependent decarboxylase family protein [Pseudophaeobacter flagellatus]|uniref:pyridoxal phosphate-dependent decarboxylase family protein n=1 Tax=Pseudophaeobacter flagellatus TaxID=2899119 RepID=UPI001E2D7864|nr:aminotransferase class V-fold PLP-dependent enzyme [Pseudophaeobacter flagellatus]MCD9146940.1 aminotransferase class V-fold PLP-dependent enzyme [Pseudophaeobacter flagellatus]
MDEDQLLQEADRRGRSYVSGAETRRVFPSDQDVAALSGFDEALPDQGRPAAETIALMDDLGSPATVASNGPNYFGFVIGASLPVAAAAERLALAWDQCASTEDGSPTAYALEQQASKWMLEILDLPRSSAVAFGTSATACGLSCLAAARADLLARQGWDVVNDGLHGAPEVKVVVPASTHVTVRKALQVLGFGWNRVVKAPVDDQGRILPDQLPDMDATTLLVLQAGEVNTGEFDDFAAIIPRAKAAGAWVHVDGAFGLWARAAPGLRDLTTGIEGADSWTTDGHKWLNTPYDGAMAICRDPQALARVMNSDAAYSTASAEAQKNLTLEFSRRARGIPIWAALRSLGKAGIADLVTGHHNQARRICAALEEAGFEVLNRVVLNQVLVRGGDDAATEVILQKVQQSGTSWFGGTVWQDRPAFRISLSSFRTQDRHVDQLINLLVGIGAKGEG